MLGLNRDSRLILISQFLVGITFGLFFFILPVHIRALGASPSQVGITLSAAGLSMLIVVLPFGYLADRYDLRKLMIITKLFPIIPIALLGVVNHWQIVMVLLFVIYFEGAVVTVFNSYLTRTLDAQDLQRTLTTISFGYLLGEVLFRSIGARIAEEVGMSLVFYLAAIAAIISAIPIASIKVHLSPQDRSEIDYRQLFSSKAFITISIYIFAVLVIMEIGVALMPNYLDEVVGLDLATIGQMGSLAALGGAILSLTVGRLKGESGLIAVLTSMIISMFLVVVYPVGIILPIGIFLMGSLYASHPITDALMGRNVSVHLSGLAFGFVGLLVGISLLLGPIIAGVLYEISPQMPMIVTVGGLLVLIVAAITIPRALEREYS
jgi:ENTS family enterobactin (siderophore) exporter